MVRTRRLLMFLLGAWLGVSLWVNWSAFQNQRAVAEIVNHPSERASRLLHAIGPERMAYFMRYQAAEMNRTLFEQWGWVQLALSIMVFFVLLFGTSAGRPSLALALFMGATVAVMIFFLIPQIAGAGRAADFVILSASTPERGRLRMLHAAYVAAEAAKLAAGIILALIYSWGSTRERRRSRRREVDSVHHADDRHINR